MRVHLDANSVFMNPHAASFARYAVGVRARSGASVVCYAQHQQHFPRAMRDSDGEQKEPGVRISPCHGTGWEDASRKRPETICLVAACELAAMERPSMFFSVFSRVREKNTLASKA